MAKRAARKKADIPANETKEQCFVRVVRPRIQAALKRIGLVSNCSGPNYVYTPEQSGKIVKVLLDAVANVKASFDKVSVKQQEFEL